MMNKNILTDYVLEKIEDILEFDHDNGKYTIPQFICEDKSMFRLFLPFSIDDKVIVDYTEKGTELVKKSHYKRYIRFNPIKYKSHLHLLEEALIKFGENNDQKLESNVLKEDDGYHGIVLITFKDGSKETFMETKYAYKKENEALLKAILLAISTSYKEDEE